MFCLIPCQIFLSTHHALHTVGTQVLVEWLVGWMEQVPWFSAHMKSLSLLLQSTYFLREILML